ncbi:hypothetical protein M422DRAFT_162386, partial [Sphaerobolus stellatus SS14]
TTQKTITERMRQIEMTELPRTFQNVITITRGMGLRYIWIDSLCIIQGDKIDWEGQSAVMSDIYASCYLNIATTRAGVAEGGHEGCLGARWTTWNLLEWPDEFLREGNSNNEEPQMTKMKCEVRSFKVEGIQQDIRIRLALKSSHGDIQTPRRIEEQIETAPSAVLGYIRSVPGTTVGPSALQ